MNLWCPRAAAALILVVLISCCSANDIVDDLQLQNLDADHNNNDYQQHTVKISDFIKEAMWKKCSRQLSSTCLKLSVMRLIDRLSKDTSYTILPGVSITCQNYTDSSKVTPELAKVLIGGDAPLDRLLLYTVDKYLRSLIIKIRLLDYENLNITKTFRNGIIDVVSTTIGTGRGKGGGGGGGGGMMGMGMMFGGTVLVIGLSGLAAIAGKAMMTSLLALMLAALSSMKGNGGESKSTTYEIVSRPVVSHAHTHSSEIQHEHHGHYKRSIRDFDTPNPLLTYPYRGYLNNHDGSK